MDCDTTLPAHTHTRRSWALVYVYEALFLVWLWSYNNAPWAPRLANLESSCGWKMI